MQRVLPLVDPRYALASAADKLRFCAKHIVTKEGRRFDVSGRPWVADELFGPADGWHLWPQDLERICDECRQRAGSIVEWDGELLDSLVAHVNATCAGLRLEPILVTVLNLPRREGKTLNAAAFNLSTIFLEERRFITYLASAGKQTRALFDENYRIPIEQSRTLSKRCSILGERIDVPKTGSRLEVVETSHGSITGRGRTHIVIDEARDIDSRVVSALIPSMRDQNGLVCPMNSRHARLNISLDAPKKCGICGARLRPWYGRIIITSSSGILDGGDKDWFAQLVEQQEKEPHEHVHLFRSDESRNPQVSATSGTMMSEVFGQLPAMQSYIEVELSNTSRRKGEDFVSARALDLVVDTTLTNHEGSDARCVAFLDTSTTQELTSLVFVADDEAKSTTPWEHIVVLRIDTWDPKETKRGMMDGDTIMAHLDRYMPLFTALLELFVDVRVMPWARDLVISARADKPGWGKRVKSFHGQTRERDTSWHLLEQRILSRRLRIPKNHTLIEELKGVRRIVRPDNTIEIRDRDRRKRHADIAEGVAACCWMIWKDQTRPRVGMTRANEVSDVIARMWKPRSAGFGVDSF